MTACLLLPITIHYCLFAAHYCLLLSSTARYIPFLPTTVTTACSSTLLPAAAVQASDTSQ